jgi:transcriptional regulator with XRE-family HTH domain
MQYHFGYTIIEKGDKMIASRIKLLRETQKISQAELAKKLGITRSSVNAWEMGLSIPSTPYIVELASLFHVSTDYLLNVPKTASLPLNGLSDQEVAILSELVCYFKKSHHTTEDPCK